MTSPSLNALCDDCATLELQPGSPTAGQPPTTRYRTSLRAVEESARAGCHFCTLVFTRIAGPNDFWTREPDGRVRYEYVLSEAGGPPQLRVKWGLVTIKFKVSPLSDPSEESPVLPHDTLQISPKSELIFSMISNWLSTCSASHQNCHPTAPSTLPRRVINVGSAPESRDPHLWVTAGELGSYAALSYRWGTSPTLTTTTHNLAAHTQGIPLEDFPATLRDAILVCRALGLQYLWVDALCIIQDSAQDWAEQAGQMAGIYQNAQLTISADSAESSGAGFLADRSPQAIRSCSYPQVGMTVHPDIADVFAVVDAGGLSRRGWVLQERVFSRRVVHWTRFEVGWQCHEMQASERQPGGQRNLTWLGSNVRKMFVAPPLLPADAGRSGDGARDVYSAWYQLVQEYSSRLLTYPDKDKLVALSSIAQTFHSRYSDILGPEESYISGLWRGDLARGLSFRYGTGTYGRQQVGLPQVEVCNLEDPSTWKYRAPSFSWTRGEGAASWDYRGGAGPSLPGYDVEVLSVHNVTTGDNRWGAVESCWIMLRGVVSSRETMRAEVGEFWESPDDDMPDTYEGTSQGHLYIRLTVMQNPDGELEQTWLAIYPTGETGEYRRTGTIRTVGAASLHRVDKTDIKLV
ncbi:hypothetical protein LZ554_003988 [Drepanopeziza brunnea f. sp. 'monogermtubi']|nr:hypothetical protein LZ554_003988 [Drepanopeziza brunnea f. sp. 'monogermtubi']